MLKEFGQILYLMVPILLTGLSVGMAFQAGVFNIGVAGQYTMGIFFALVAAFYLKVPEGIHWMVCILAGSAGGLLWGMLPGALKAYRGVNEVISAIMLNYIGMYWIDMWVKGSDVMYEASRARTKYLPESAQIPSLGIAGSNAGIAIFFALGIAVLLWILLKKTVAGYELKAVGLNPNAAVAAGMNNRRLILFSMAAGGALAGLGGACAILSPAVIPGSSITYEPVNVIAAAGFQGIAAAMLGKSHPFGIIAASVFLAVLRRVGRTATLYGWRIEAVDIIIAVVLLAASFAAEKKRRKSS